MSLMPGSRLTSIPPMSGASVQDEVAVLAGDEGKRAAVVPLDADLVPWVAVAGELVRSGDVLDGAAGSCRDGVRVVGHGDELDALAWGGEHQATLAICASTRASSLRRRSASFSSFCRGLSRSRRS